jgi:hypothetical protein
MADKPSHLPRDWRENGARTVLEHLADLLESLAECIEKNAAGPDPARDNARLCKGASALIKDVLDTASFQGHRVFGTLASHTEAVSLAYGKPVNGAKKASLAAACVREALDHLQRTAPSTVAESFQSSRVLRALSEKYRALARDCGSDESPGGLDLAS